MSSSSNHNSVLCSFCICRRRLLQACRCETSDHSYCQDCIVYTPLCRSLESKEQKQNQTKKAKGTRDDPIDIDIDEFDDIDVSSTGRRSEGPSAVTWTCSICLEDMKQNTYVVLHCFHLYHIDCIRSWVRIHSSCPSCRAAISGQEKRSIMSRNH